MWTHVPGREDGDLLAWPQRHGWHGLGGVPPSLLGATSFWAIQSQILSSLWWLLDAVLQLLLIAAVPLECV